MEPEDKTKNKVVQTFADDMAGVIETSEGGLIKRIIRQEELSEIEKKNLSPESRKNKIFIIASLFFTILAFGVLAYVMITKKEIGTVPAELQATPLIFNDKTTFLEIGGLTKEGIGGTVLRQANVIDVKAGGVEGMYLTENKSIINFPRFLDLIQASLNREKIGFFGENFLVGATKQKTNDTFILLQVRSFVDVFNEMRTWETKMLSDLYPFFRMMVDPSTSYLFTKNFEDGIIQNKNARILYDNDRNIVLMYVFLDDTSIVITNTENAVREVMLRLVGSKIKT